MLMALGGLFERGWVDEVRSLLAEGVSPDATPMKAIGYREIASHLRGELDFESLRSRVVTAVSQFAKRQGTWFNREPSIRWVEPSPDLASQLLPEVKGLLLK